MFKKINKQISLHFNLLKTLCFNLLVFPFKEAIHLPVFIYGKFVWEDIYRGCIKLKEVKPHILKMGGGIKTEVFGSSSLSKSYFRCPGQMIVGGSVIIENGCRISVCKNAELKIGSNVHISRNVKIHVKESITIGENVRIGWEGQLIDTNFHYCLHDGRISRRNRPIILGHNVWLANSVSVSKGVILPPYCIVAQKSLVNKDFSNAGEHCLIGGMPAKVISTGVTRLLNVEEKIDGFFSSGVESIDIDDVSGIIKQGGKNNNVDDSNASQSAS